MLDVILPSTWFVAISLFAEIDCRREVDFFRIGKNWKATQMLADPSPLPYHQAVVEFLQIQEPGLWKWFASTLKRGAEAEAVRLNLLKSTYRLERSSQPNLYEIADAVRERMHLDCGVTLYQAQTNTGLNASLAYLPGEAHITLVGPLATVLSENELRAVLAHELAHFLLLEDGQGAYLVASDLLRALSADPATGIAASESARLYSLWTEIYADRWACRVSNDVMATIATLIKIETGMGEVSAESYLRQADEIFAKSDEQADHFSHPEPYIRARSLRFWAERGDDCDSEIERMIEGRLNIHRLDLLSQKRATELTRRFLQTLLAPKWHRTEAALAHAKRFFPDFGFPEDAKDRNWLKAELESSHSSLADYLCYLMLDFVTADRDLGDVALSGALVLARDLGIDKRFGELVQKELALGKKAFAKIDKDAAAILAKTEANHL